jgi:hypothetical protein
MRILFANNQLRDRAGSELFTLELASRLASDHSVAIFTFLSGDISNIARDQFGIEVFEPSNISDLKKYEPDLVHSHHISCAALALSVFPEKPIVHGLLGPSASLEALPSGWRSLNAILPVSEEVHQQAVRAGLDESVPVHIFRNWYDESKLCNIRKRDRAGGRFRVLSVTNRLDTALETALDAVSGEVEVVRVGLPWRPQVIDGQVLSDFDLVVTIGRTAILAAACGVPCLVAGPYGSDGLITEDNYRKLAPRNFSGRTFRTPIDANYLNAQIALSANVRTERLSERIRADFSLSRRVEEIQVVYDSVLRQGVPKRSAVPPAEGYIFAEWAAVATRNEIILRDQSRQINDQAAKLSQINEELRAEREQSILKLIWRIAARLFRKIAPK